MTRNGVLAIIIGIVLLIVFPLVGGLLVDDNPLLGALIGLLVVLLLLILLILFQPSRSWLGDFIGRHIRKSIPQVRLLLIGLGRSGKTTIIRQILTNDLMPNQEASTSSFDVYEQEKRLGLKDPQHFIAAIADYRGQKLSQITVEHPVDFFGKPGQRLINAIVFVVDLFPEILDETGQPLDDDTIIGRYATNGESQIADRIAKHREYITQYTVEQIFALAYSRQNLTAVRLLVNKIDLLKPIIAKGHLSMATGGYIAEVNEAGMDDYVRSLIASIAEPIQAACQANEVDDFAIHLISAKTGENVQQVASQIFANCLRRQRP